MGDFYGAFLRWCQVSSTPDISLIQAALQTVRSSFLWRVSHYQRRWRLPAKLVQLGESSDLCKWRVTSKSQRDRLDRAVVRIVTLNCNGWSIVFWAQGELYRSIYHHNGTITRRLILLLADSSYVSRRPQLAMAQTQRTSPLTIILWRFELK